MSETTTRGPGSNQSDLSGPVSLRTIDAGAAPGFRCSPPTWVPGWAFLPADRSPASSLRTCRLARSLPARERGTDASTPSPGGPAGHDDDLSAILPAGPDDRRT